MCLMEWNFEQEPHEATDETGVNLRAYFDRMQDEKMRQYSPSWTDEQVIEWDVSGSTLLGISVTVL
jgi:hypothetical protein